jgi:hypothetical protein
MQMIVPILIGVTILVALVALYMSRETWRIYHIVLGFFLLVANVLFLYLAGRALDTHRQWRSEVRKYETAYAQQYDQFKLLTGELDGRGDVVVKRAEKVTQKIPWTIDDWKAELAEATYGRGRVLAGLVPKNVDPATGAITAAALQAEPVTLPAGSSVHVFQSQPPRERKLPYKGTEVVITTPPIVRFIGSYIVTTVTGNTINLAPVHPERPTKIDGPLVIYEVAPVDTHEAFAHLGPNDIKLFPPTVPPAVVEHYLKDGKEVDPKVAEDPKNPDYKHIWRTVRFTKEYSSEAAKAEQPAQPAAPPAAGDAADGEVGDQAPDAEGAVVTREMKFQPGDEAVLDRQTAADLVKAGVAENVNYVYRRPLNDYPVAFREVRAQLLATNVKSTELQRQIEATQKSIELAKQTEQLRQQEAARLSQDLEKFRFEAETIQKLHDALVTSVKDATDQIGSLKQSIDTQAEQLARLQLKAAEAIDRRTGATAASTAQSAAGR